MLIEHNIVVKDQSTSALDNFLSPRAVSLNVTGRQVIAMERE